jgi:hypothetical protein
LPLYPPNVGRAAITSCDWHEIVRMPGTQGDPPAKMSTAPEIWLWHGSLARLGRAGAGSSLGHK